MEVELKFLVEEEFIQERIFQDDHIRALSEGSEPEMIPMHAVYFDTETGDLMKGDMAYRVRMEGERAVATLKWAGSVDNGLHTRGELNAAVGKDFFREPAIEVFRGSQAYETLSSLVGEKKLVPLMEMEFTRIQVRLDTGRSISMLSYDKGEIRTKGGSEPISEMEIELYSGDREEILALGDELAQKYNLKLGNRSKYSRGLELSGFAEV